MTLDRVLLFEAEHVRCDSCEQYVPREGAHSCWDAAALRAIRDAERAVVDAAKAHEVATNCYTAIRFQDYSTPVEVQDALDDVTTTTVALHLAVRALRALEGA